MIPHMPYVYIVLIAIDRYSKDQLDPWDQDVDPFGLLDPFGSKRSNDVPLGLKAEQTF